MTTIVSSSVFSCFSEPLKWGWLKLQRHVQYVTKYERNKKDLEDETKQLRDRSSELEKHINHWTRNGADISKVAQNWEDRARNILQQKSNLQQEIERVNANCCSKTKSRYVIGKKISKLKDSTTKLIQDGVRPEDIPLPPMAPATFECSSDFVIFKSRNRAMGEVKKALLATSKFSIVGVSGMGGIGKTYMVKKLASDVLEAKQFDQVAVAVVSRNPDVKGIQQQIVESLRLSLSLSTEQNRAADLKKKLRNCKSILVVLDDVWEKLDMASIGIPQEGEVEEGSICKILLTTRRKNVCEDMKSHAHISLEILDEEDSRTLFCKHVGETEYTDIESKVIAECKGLPIALSTLGAALRNKNRKDWEFALHRLAESENPDDGDNYKRICESIKLSYDFLDDVYKRFFLMCSYFPEDHNISKEDLARYSLASGLFKLVQTMEQARGEADLRTKNLTAWCLLLNGNKRGTFKMHDVVRDVAIQIASSKSSIIQARLQLDDWPRVHDVENYKAISVIGNNIKSLPDDIQCPHLEILLLQDNRELKEIPSAFFDTMKSLRILDLKGTDITSLSPSLKALEKLRLLSLDDCKLKDISALGNLKKLEILSLKMSGALVLPESITRLKCLMILDLTLAISLMIPPNILSQLGRLEELCLQGSFADWSPASEESSGGMETRASFQELLGLDRLVTLRVDISNFNSLPDNLHQRLKWKEFAICVSDQPFRRMIVANASKDEVAYSKRLALSNGIADFPSWFKENIAGRAENLVYQGCKNLHNILIEHDEGNLAGLKSLTIDHCNSVHLMKVEDNLRFNIPVFRCLEELTINQMDSLQEICVGDLPDESFQNLKFLEVQQCMFLKHTLLTPRLLEKLQNIETLVINGNSIEAVLGLESLESQVLQKITTIKLQNLYKMSHFIRGPSEMAAFNNLLVVTIEECNKLQNLFSRNLCNVLVQLEELWVMNCSLLEEIVREEQESATTEIQEIASVNESQYLVFPSLRTLVLRHLPHLNRFCCGIERLGCPKLKQLHVEYCPKYRTEYESQEDIQMLNEQQMRQLQKIRFETN